jgi:hypothetical protein
MDARATLGANGGQYIEGIADSAPFVGKWCAIQALTECQFTTLTNDAGYPDALVLAAGKTIFGNFTAIQLNEGSGCTGIAYNSDQ